MNYFVYRNFTTENLFQGFDIGFSGYNDISDTPNAKNYIWFYLPEIKIATNDIVDEIQGYKGKLELLLNQYILIHLTYYTITFLFQQKFQILKVYPLK